MPTETRSEVVVITGASAGVGRATAIEFARHGAKIALLARGQAGLDGARRDVEAAGGVALPIPTDVADAAQVEAAAERVERELGEIDIWVNNAMTSVFAPFKKIKPEEFRRVTEVTYLGSVHGAMSAMRRMLPRNRGTLLQVGSALAYRSIPLQSAYCGAKHGIAGFIDSLRCELIHDHSAVEITQVHLPAMNTPQFRWVLSRLPRQPQPVPPIYQPEVAARAIYYAAHHPRREFWVGPPTVLSMVGQKFIPGLLDEYLGRTGYDSQQTHESADPDRPHNLWEPVDRDQDFGEHGGFGHRSKERSTQVWLDTHPAVLLAGAVAILGAGIALWQGSKESVEETEERLRRAA